MSAAGLHHFPGLDWPATRSASGSSRIGAAVPGRRLTGRRTGSRSARMSPRRDPNRLWATSHMYLCEALCIRLDPLIAFVRRSEMHQSSPSVVNGTPVLTDAELRQLARFIAKELEALHGLQPALLTAADVAKQYGLSRGWVYKHSRDLGGQRMGTGPKARLSLRSHEIQARLSELQASEDGMPRLRPSGTRQPVELLPIGPARSSRERAPTLRARYDRREDPSRPADRSHATPPS